MTDPLTFYLDKFREVWQTGQDACITIECHAGQAWLSIHQRLPPPPPPHPFKQHRGRPSPSRLRRRARRERERSAAVKATNESESASTTVAQIPPSHDAAVQAEVTAAEQAASPAPEEPQHHQVSQVVAEQATHGHGHVPRNQDHPDEHEQAEQSLHGSESLEFDIDDSMNFTRSTIPQLDGNSSLISQNESRHSTTAQSKYKACLKILETKEDFQWHFETKYGREDCKILQSML